jgi:hypothetical protein
MHLVTFFSHGLFLTYRSCKDCVLDTTSFKNGRDTCYVVPSLLHYLSKRVCDTSPQKNVYAMGLMKASVYCRTLHHLLFAYPRSLLILRRRASTCRRQQHSRSRTLYNIVSSVSAFDTLNTPLHKYLNNVQHFNHRCRNC